MKYAFETVTIAPRLKYSTELLDMIISDLESYLKFPSKIEDEKTFLFCLEILVQIRQKMQHVSIIRDIYKLLPAVHIIRTISAKIYHVKPTCSKKLCELSVHLGSIMVDSAAISAAKFDFNHSNYEAATLLDKVKLMTDSKINKQYSNLDCF